MQFHVISVDNAGKIDDTALYKYIYESTKISIEQYNALIDYCNLQSNESLDQEESSFYVDKNEIVDLNTAELWKLSDKGN